MQFIFKKGQIEVPYYSKDFWMQYDEVIVEEPEGWSLKYIIGEICHKFDYCQSTGRGDYYDEYIMKEHYKNIEFSSNAKKNAEILKNIDVDGFIDQAIFIKK